MLSATLMLATMLLGDCGYAPRCSAGDGGNTVAYVRTETSGINATVIGMVVGGTTISTAPSGTSWQGTLCCDVDSQNGDTVIAFTAYNTAYSMYQGFISVNGGTPIAVSSPPTSCTFLRVAIHSGHIMVFWNSGVVTSVSTQAPYPWTSWQGSPPKIQVYDYTHGATTVSHTYTPYSLYTSGAKFYSQYNLGDVCVNSQTVGGNTVYYFTTTHTRSAYGQAGFAQPGVFVMGWTYDSTNAYGMTARYGETLVNGSASFTSASNAPVSQIAAFNDGSTVVVYDKGGEHYSPGMWSQRFDSSGNAITGTRGNIIACSSNCPTVDFALAGPQAGCPGRWSVNSNLSDTSTYKFIIAYDSPNVCGFTSDPSLNMGMDLVYAVVASNSGSWHFATTQSNTYPANFWGGPAVSSPAVNKVAYMSGVGPYPYASNADSIVLGFTLANACP